MEGFFANLQQLSYDEIVTTFDTNLDLVLEKTLPMTPEQVSMGYTNPEMLLKCFCPRPWKVVACPIDVFRSKGLGFMRLDLSYLRGLRWLLA